MSCVRGFCVYHKIVTCLFYHALLAVVLAIIRCTQEIIIVLLL